MTDAFSFELRADDPLGVLSSTAPVAEGAAHVRIVPQAVEAFARERGGRGIGTTQRLPQEALHCAFLPPERRLNYLLVLEALNFCFWDAAPRWRVTWEGATYDGYWALAAALRRAVVADGVPLWDAAWMAALDRERLARVLRGEGRPPPLLDARLEHIREAGQVLLSRWGGSFGNLVAKSAGDAPSLVQRIVAEFPSFRDEARWQGAPVRFYKRAQICVADLARLLAGHPLGQLRGLEHLTAFADYKVPQVLRAMGLLALSPELAHRVDAGDELPAGCPEEVELRACTVWACEWAARACNRQVAAGQPPVTAAEMDALLWDAGQDSAGMPPYHRTRTVYY